MYLIGWKKHIFSISVIVGVISVGYLFLVGALALHSIHAEKASLPASFRPGYYELNTSFQNSSQRSLIVITANATHRQGTISIAAFDNSMNDHGSWWVEDGWLDASLQGPVVKKEQETLLIHVILTFTSQGTIVGQGRGTIIASLGSINGSPIIEAASVSTYQFSGFFLHT